MRVSFLCLRFGDALKIQKCIFWEVVCVKMHDFFVNAIRAMSMYDINFSGGCFDNEPQPKSISSYKKDVVMQQCADFDKAVIENGRFLKLIT